MFDKLNGYNFNQNYTSNNSYNYNLSFKCYNLFRTWVFPKMVTPKVKNVINLELLI